LRARKRTADLKRFATGYQSDKLKINHCRSGRQSSTHDLSGFEESHMGLDGVELIMDVEDRFCTSFPDDQLERMQTIGDLHDFIMSRIRQQHSDFCLSAAMFYPIRRILVDQFNVDRDNIRPATSLESLVDTKSRSKFWSNIESVLAIKLPRLKRSKCLQWTGDAFPPECSTVKQLIKNCVTLNRITDEFGPDDNGPVFNIVQQLVAEIACVDESLLSRETNFVCDLGF